MTRKSAKWVSGAFLAQFALMPLAAQAQDQLVIASFGGAYTESQTGAFFEPYTAETGNRIVAVDYNGGLAELRAQVESGNPSWDVIDLELQDALRACDEALIETIDMSILAPAPDGSPAEEDFLPGTLMDCGVGTIVWSTVLAFDASKFPEDPPSEIADLFDLEKYPGKRGLSNKPNINLEWALMADGVPVDEVYDTLGTAEGLNRAFAKLDEIKSEVIFWDAHAQAPQLLADGEVVMTGAANGRISDAIAKENMPFAIIWDGQIWNLDVWAISSVSQNKEAALDFIQFSTTSDRLADQVKLISYGPVRKSSQELVPEEARQFLPTYEANFQNALQNDNAFWADHQDEIGQRWATWMVQ